MRNKTINEVILAVDSVLSILNEHEVEIAEISKIESLPEIAKSLNENGYSVDGFALWKALAPIIEAKGDYENAMRHLAEAKESLDGLVRGIGAEDKLNRHLPQRGDGENE